MPVDPETFFQLVARVATFLLVMSLWIGVILIWAARRSHTRGKLKTSLRLDEPESEDKRVLRLWHKGKATSMTVSDVSGSRSIIDRLNVQCRLAGWPISAAVLLVLVGGGSFIVAVAVAFITANVFLAVGVGIAVIIVFRMIMSGQIARGMKRFEQQLVDAMELAARSLRAGHPLPAAFQLISEEMAAPISDVFGELCQRHEMGESFAVSLHAAAEASMNSDMRMFATSVSIQLRAGGNLADLMERLAAVIRERMRLNRRVRVLTSQAQMSKRILVALPFLVFVMLNALNPAYMSPLYTTTAGQVMLGIAAVGLAMGSWVIGRMAVLKY